MNRMYCKLILGLTLVLVLSCSDDKEGNDYIGDASPYKTFIQYYISPNAIEAYAYADSLCIIDVTKANVIDSKKIEEFATLAAAHGEDAYRKDTAFEYSSPVNCTMLYSVDSIRAYTVNGTTDSIDISADVQISCVGVYTAKNIIDSGYEKNKYWYAYFDEYYTFDNIYYSSRIGNIPYTTLSGYNTEQAMWQSDTFVLKLGDSAKAADSIVLAIFLSDGNVVRKTIK